MEAVTLIFAMLAGAGAGVGATAFYYSRVILKLRKENYQFFADQPPAVTQYPFIRED